MCMRIPFLPLIINRILIVILGVFSTILINQITETTLTKGDRYVQSLYQGSHVYTYIQPLKPLVNIWAVWDTKWYVSIADDGYSTQRRPYTRVDNKGFLPVYPILLYIFSTFIFSGNTHVAGIVLSNIFLILSLFCIEKLIRSEPKLSTNAGLRLKDVALYIILFPTSYYLSAIYPESLFLFLSILVFYFVRLRKIALACFIFSLACLTKTFGIFLIIPILMYLFTERKEVSISKLLSYIGISISLPLLYCVYMYYISGDALAYIHIQQAFFYHTWENPLAIIFASLIIKNPFVLWSTAFIVYGLILIGFAAKKIPVSYTAYALCCLLFAPATGVLDGSSRYMASLFVLPIALAACVTEEKNKYIWYTSFAIIQGFAIFWWVIGAGFAS